LVCVGVIGAVLVVFVLAGYAGAMLFAINLVVGDLMPNHLHDNELFAGMRIEGYKSHLRIHVAPDGLHVRAIGLEKVAARWTKDLTPGEGRIKRMEVDRFFVPRNPAPEGVADRDTSSPSK
jgi:hypothetical protein